MSRKLWIKLRVSEEEKAEFEAKAEAAGMTLADLIRYRLLQYRMRKTSVEQESLRLIARAGANLNQVARWVNTYKSEAEAIKVIVYLDAVLRELKRRGPCI
ncbi:MAG TPA: plasmid mobilization relaxosome protein MobC [Desulfovibrio sp.]|jgi:antitoxin component of RelBE/YafQ-DinJ toxin-antitoxin module|uniref:plasmid mobilization protein n=1 Tax=Desulfovibrio sp. TaxID=885 RepID=UPI00202DB8CD|nr:MULTISPECIES: plasmid mobilization relaxosome protein MobC [Desulfovibrio]MCM0755301.1 MobC family plasmid mobilization relaxosome protein [Desulfovibrio aminophilus]HMM40118.1 plasmid mobilization relaxosome protein MobC [Desulfovibrio sp.]